RCQPTDSLHGLQDKPRNRSADEPGQGEGDVEHAHDATASLRREPEGQEVTEKEHACAKPVYRVAEAQFLRHVQLGGADVDPID
nr:hypothetical protein [Tanacetum cinerariifolium]